MIFITKDIDGKPLFKGFINHIADYQYNDNTYTNVIIGTSETMRDETKRYSSWSARLIGDAARDKDRFSKGDLVSIYGVKMTKVDSKGEDGAWQEGKMYMSISRMTNEEYTPTVAAEEPQEENFNPLSDDELPF